jgi:hypothetical protein
MPALWKPNASWKIGSPLRSITTTGWTFQPGSGARESAAAECRLNRREWRSEDDGKGCRGGSTQTDDFAHVRMLLDSVQHKRGNGTKRHRECSIGGLMTVRGNGTRIVILPVVPALWSIRIFLRRMISHTKMPPTAKIDGNRLSWRNSNQMHVQRSSHLLFALFNSKI